MVSGGKPFSVSITSEQFKKIRELVDAGLAATKEHASTRQMGTSILSATDEKGENEKQAYLKMNSKEKETINNWLCALKPANHNNTTDSNDNDDDDDSSSSLSILSSSNSNSNIGSSSSLKISASSSMGNMKPLKKK
jgi:hypothetical protein